MNRTVNPYVSEMAKVPAGIPAGSSQSNEDLRQCVKIGAGAWSQSQVPLSLEAARGGIDRGGRESRPGLAAYGSDRSRQSGGAVAPAEGAGVGVVDCSAESGAGFFQGCLAARKTDPELASILDIILTGSATDPINKILENTGCTAQP